ERRDARRAEVEPRLGALAVEAPLEEPLHAEAQLVAERHVDDRRLDEHLHRPGVELADHLLDPRVVRARSLHDERVPLVVGNDRDRAGRELSRTYRRFALYGI